MPKLSGAVTPFGENDVYSLGDGNYLSRGVHVVKNLDQMLAITPARRKGVYTALGVNANPDPTLCFVKDKGDGKPAMYYLNTEPGTEATSLSNWKLYTPVTVDGVVAIQDYFTPASSTLVNGVGTVGYVYIAKEAGSFNGETYAVGDWTMYLDGEWKLIPVGLSALPPAAHTHAMSDITGLAAALANKIATSEISTTVYPGTKLPTNNAVIDYTYSKEEVDSLLSGANNAINDLINDASPSGVTTYSGNKIEDIATELQNSIDEVDNKVNDHAHPNANEVDAGFMSTSLYTKTHALPAKNSTTIEILVAPQMSISAGNILSSTAGSVKVGATTYTVATNANISGSSISAHIGKYFFGYIMESGGAYTTNFVVFNTINDIWDVVPFDGIAYFGLYYYEASGVIRESPYNFANRVKLPDGSIKVIRGDGLLDLSGIGAGVAITENSPAFYHPNLAAQDFFGTGSLTIKEALDMIGAALAGGTPPAETFYYTDDAGNIYTDDTDDPYTQTELANTPLTTTVAATDFVVVEEAGEARLIVISDFINTLDLEQ